MAQSDCQTRWRTQCDPLREAPECDLRPSRLASSISLCKSARALALLLFSLLLLLLLLVRAEPRAVKPRQAGLLGPHYQPSFVFGPRNRSVNMSHVLLDEYTGSVYVGATNWLFQLAAADLRPEQALRTGPAAMAGSQEHQNLNVNQNQQSQPQQATRTSQEAAGQAGAAAGNLCAPADCQAQRPQALEPHLLLHHLHHAHSADLSIPQRGGKGAPAPASMHSAGPPSQRPARGWLGGPSNASGPQPAAQHQNNYNKLLLLEPEQRQLLVCGTLSEGACRRHQLGQVSNFSESVSLPVAGNEEHSSTVALVVPLGGGAPASGGRGRPGQASPDAATGSLLYVAATSSRQGLHRELVPAISARHLDQSLQVVERSFTESARVDIAMNLRDYFLVHYVSAFQHSDYVYFGTVQRRSPLLQLEEWGYLSRLARLCVNDLSFQSYVELSLECKTEAANYNLLQDLQLAAAGPQLAKALAVPVQSALLLGAFAQSRDHSMRPARRSAVCAFPMDQVERVFAQNIHLCLSGSVGHRNMSYIAGSVNDCPKPGSANAANQCSGEPLKLNGSLPLAGRVLAELENELVTALMVAQVNTSPLGGAQPGPSQSHSQHSAGHKQEQSAGRQQQQPQQPHHHQLLLLGTADGAFGRLGLIGAGSELRARELDWAQVGAHEEAILADMQLLAPSGGGDGHQFALVASASRLVKLRVDGCRAGSQPANQTSPASSLADQCNLCQGLQDPTCGWCGSALACLGRAECQQHASAHRLAPHWSPFNQIACSDYQALVPHQLALQAPLHQLVEVNVRVRPLAGRPGASSQHQHQLPVQLGPQASQLLAQAQFSCHFEWRHLAGPHAGHASPSASSSSTKALQARLNPSTGTLALACPLPAPGQRPREGVAAEQRARLSVRPAPGEPALPALLAAAQLAAPEEAWLMDPAGPAGPPTGALERELLLYDCSALSGCSQCLAERPGGAACAWCPLSNRCTFDHAHPELGCVASALASTQAPLTRAGPHLPSGSLRAAHLAQALPEPQAALYALAWLRPDQCADSRARPAAGEPPGPASSSAAASGSPAPGAAASPAELLVPSGSRRALELPLNPQASQQLAAAAGSRAPKLECLLELEGARFRLAARLQPGGSALLCQESQLEYQDELASQRARLWALANEEPLPDSLAEVILYKCHLFGISPPALASSAAQGGHSSAAWLAQRPAAGQLGALAGRRGSPSPRRPGQTLEGAQADCSMCANVDRRFQCVWCSGQCRHSDQCGTQTPASVCPPPRIDSIQPSSGPIEGGTLLTIQGSNLGSNEREVQDKITVAGEPCQLVMYTVSTRIVCKTGASLQALPMAATVFVRNRAGLTSALEKFHYKAVHLTDVSPRFGPVSGGTKLTLTGSNLNIGSRTQIFLDDLPCALHREPQSAWTSNQISCLTAPNLAGSSSRITRLTLIIDNSTHHLPYPFTYQPDPIITSIEPTESFLSGGRLILVSGQHLSSAHSIRLLVFHEHRPELANSTACTAHNDTLITCLTPAISRQLLLPAGAGTNQVDQEPSDVLGFDPPAGAPLVRLKMSFIMDGVRAVAKLDEYYHHLPHYMAYIEDPHFFRLPGSGLVDFSQELVLPGRNLDIKQLDQDMLIFVGAHNCPIKSISSHQITCRPASKISALMDQSGRLLDRPQLPITVLVGENLRFQVGHMQYSSRQFQFLDAPPGSEGQPLPVQAGSSAIGGHAMMANGNQLYPMGSMKFVSGQPGGSLLAVTDDPARQQTESSSPSVAILISLSIFGFVLGFGATFMFALSRLRQSRAEREYKRIQLQMGSLDINGQPLVGSGVLFDANDTIHINNTSSMLRSRNALDYVNQALAAKSKLFYHHLNRPQTNNTANSNQRDVSPLTLAHHQPSGHLSLLANHSPPVPPSQRLLYSNPNSPLNQLHQQHLVKLASNGTIINSIGSHSSANHQNRQPYTSASSGSSDTSHSSASQSSSQSSPGGSARNSNNLFTLQQIQAANGSPNIIKAQTQLPLLPQSNQTPHQRLQKQLTPIDKNDPTPIGVQTANSRNFCWTQEAPSTIVPYAVIEACNLTLEGKSAIKDYL